MSQGMTDRATDGPVVRLSVRPAPILDRALAHITHLAETIGPRPAGSTAEAKAFDHIRETLAQAGLESETLPVPFAPHPRFQPWLALAAGLVAAAALALTTFPALSGLALLGLIALPDALRWIRERAPRTARSQNVVAFTPAAPDAPTLILCAHVDSAPASALPVAWLRVWHARMMFVTLRVTWGLALVGLLMLIGLPLPTLIVDGVRLLALITSGLWLALEVGSQLGPRRFAPGANDNASGAGVVLALAEHTARQLPAHIRLGFLFTGAEETGLHGARAFVEHTTTRGAVLNLDMVGVGNELYALPGDGALRPLPTDRFLNQRLREADPAIIDRAFPLRSGDHAVFLRAGWPAAALQAGPDPAYHTRDDTHIDPAVLTRVVACITHVIGQTGEW